MRFIFFFVFLIFAGLGMLFIVKSSIDISTSLPAIIRPIQERAEIKSLSSGLIDTFYIDEGNKVVFNSIIAVVKDPDRDNQLSLLYYEIDWRQKLISELKILNKGEVSQTLSAIIKQPILKQQLKKYLYHQAELNINLSKSKKDLDMANALFKQKVIASKELFDKENEYDRQVSAKEAYLREQPSLWEQELALREQELKKYMSQKKQLENSKYLFEIRAPVSGTVQDISKLYPGSAIQAGQVIGTISPDVELIVECYANTYNVGLLHPYKEGRFQIDAFDYKYFGILTGKIISIDNDFSILNDKPVYKVRCSLDNTQLHLRNGYTGTIKKGMTLTARFTIAERKVWQLLWDSMDDLLNPEAPLNFK